jgi:hypothetical protein
VPAVTRLTLAALGLLLSVAAEAAGQCNPDCTHETKACVCALDGRNVTLTAIGGIERQPVRIGAALDPGDEVASTDPNAVVAITCPKSSSVKLHGRFRSVILPPGSGQDCALSLLAGNADVQTSQPTELSAGTTLMGSKRTTYAMRVSSDATVTCVVFEGEVQVNNLATGAVRPLTTLMSASWKGGALQQYGAPISESDLSSTARLYARAETARLRARDASVANPEALQRELEAKYAAVLRAPQDTRARLDLAALQTRVRLSSSALYQLDVAERLGAAGSDQAAAIAATRWVIFKQDRREQEAAKEAERLRTLDPARYKVLQDIEAKSQPVESRPPSVTAAATPAVVTPGQPTTIAVTVRSALGRPVSGAKVVVSADGGTFTGAGQPRVIDGVTSAEGIFRTEWRCQPCAPAYQFGIEVSGAGLLQSQKTTLGVKTR